MAMKVSAARLSSQSLEQARQRLRARFLKKWPGAAQGVPAAQVATSAALSPAVEQVCPLQAARERLQSRYLAKWPAADAVEVKALKVETPMERSTPHLEEARQRIRMRAMARFGVIGAETKAEPQSRAPSPASIMPFLPSGGNSQLSRQIPMPYIPRMSSPAMLRAASTTSSTMPLSGLPVPSFARPRTVSLIGAPIADGQPLGGVDLAPNALRQAGLQRIVERLNLSFEDAGNVGIGTYELTDQSGAGVKNSSIIGQKVGELHARAKAAAAAGNFVLTVGGDHSIASGSITGVHATHPDLSVIWVDAHADCNTPESSESKNYHGMPLAHVLGWFQTKLPGFDWCDQHLSDFGPLPESRVALVGIRDLDAKERQIVKNSGLHVFTMSDIDCFGIGQVMEMALACVDHAGNRPLHLSFDVDGCDPAVAPGTGTRAQGGLSYREAHYICERLAETKRLVSMDLVEVNPALDGEPRPRLHGDDEDITGTPTVSLGIELVASALGKAIL
eukprot:gb/GFBE01067156.1/.p1 GENE.gb/GFBE01067156.1/~~gb/GFBE01067156.1/.p1  ORF type:complete len:505 (+),score=98.91 gb/GFBE01067156.1/:1-1515(+)